MSSGRIEEDDLSGGEVIPKWNGLYQMPLSSWKDGGLYEKSYFQEPVPNLTTRVSTQVRIRQEGDRYYYIIQLTGELTSFLEELERNIYFHSTIYSQQCMKIVLSTYDKKLFINSILKPIIFDADKKQVIPDFPLTVNAKVKLMATCIARKKCTHSYNVFLDVKQLMISNDCVWS